MHRTCYRTDLLTEAGRAAANPETGFPDPAYNAPLEWSWVNREVPPLPPFSAPSPSSMKWNAAADIQAGPNFTHEVNPFGSQQY